MRACSVEGCTNPAHARGWCKAHYARWHRHGDPLARKPFGVPPSPLEDRFREGVATTDPGECWLWQKARDRAGYGVLTTGQKFLKAHRVAYELLVGPIPEGMTIDHLCRTPACVNPRHLEPVTLAENVRRAWEARPREHPETCKNGHPWTPENRRPKRNGATDCIPCVKAAYRRWEERQRAARTEKKAEAS